MAMMSKNFGYGGAGAGPGPGRFSRVPWGQGMMPLPRGPGAMPPGMGAMVPPGQNQAFYQPNWGNIFGPSLDRYQQQAQQSQNTQEASEWRPQGPGNGLARLGYGLRNMLGLPPTQLQQQMAQANDPQNAPQPGISGFSPQQQQAIMREAAVRGLNRTSSAQEWQQGFGNKDQAQTKMMMGGGLGQFLSRIRRQPVKRLTR